MKQKKETKKIVKKVKARVFHILPKKTKPTYPIRYNYFSRFKNTAQLRKINNKRARLKQKTVDYQIGRKK